MKLLHIAALGASFWFALLSTDICAQPSNAPTGGEPANSASTQGPKFSIDPSAGQPLHDTATTLQFKSVPIQIDGKDTGVKATIPEAGVNTLNDLAKKDLAK